MKLNKPITNFGILRIKSLRFQLSSIQHSAQAKFYKRFTQRFLQATTMGQYDDILQYLQDGTYPEGSSKSTKRDLRKRANDFFLDHGILYYGGSRGNKGTPRQVVSDKETQHRVVKQCHEGNGSAHLLCPKSSNKPMALAVDCSL